MGSVHSFIAATKLQVCTTFTGDADFYSLYGEHKMPIDEGFMISAIWVVSLNWPPNDVRVAGHPYPLPTLHRGQLSIRAPPQQSGMGTTATVWPQPWPQPGPNMFTLGIALKTMENEVNLRVTPTILNDIFPALGIRPLQAHDREAPVPPAVDGRPRKIMDYFEFGDTTVHGVNINWSTVHPFKPFALLRWVRPPVPPEDILPDRR